MRHFTLLSRLLDYPEQELIDHLPELDGLLAAERAFNEAERQSLASLIAWMRAHDLIDLQAGYVQTFDMAAEHSLHLTHHSLGDDRERGPALVELGEHYKAHGFEVATQKELPDFLPLILEYLSTLDELGARVFLGEAAAVLAQLAGNLEKAGTPYAPLVRMIEQRGRLARSAA